MARHQNDFQLEALEPRVLLSGDALLVSALAANVVAHKSVGVVHEVATPAQNHFQDSLHYNPAAESGGLFDGVSAQPIHHSEAALNPAPATQEAASVAQEQAAPVQNSKTAVQSGSAVQTAAATT